jgi:aspartate dehydrogenase
MYAPKLRLHRHGTAAEKVLDLNSRKLNPNASSAPLAKWRWLVRKTSTVGVASALVDLEMDATRFAVGVLAQRHGSAGLIEARRPFGYFSFDIFARARADNPKTSALTAYSIPQCARLIGALPVAGLAVIDYRFPGA